VDETDAIPAQDSRLRSHHLHFEWSYKRLEKGRFRWPEAGEEGNKITLSHEELMLLLGGIDLAQTSRRTWHRVTRAA
jgi:transposase